MLVNQTKITYRNNEPNRLQIMEAILIQHYNPSINDQHTGTHFPADCLPSLLFTQTVPAALNNFSHVFSPQLYFLLTRGFFNTSFPTLLTLFPTFAQCTPNLLSVSDHLLINCGFYTKCFYHPVIIAWWW